jgi:hypothetical protein
MGVVTEAGASGGKAMKFWRNGVTTKTTTTPKVTKMTVTARGDQCTGAPTMVIKADGVQIATVNVSSTTYAAYPLAIAFAAGTHKIDISLTNDLYTSATCDRNLYIDKVEFTP